MTQKSLRILTVLTVFCVALLTAGCSLKLSGGNSKKTERERKIQQVLKDELKNRHGLTEGEDYTLKNMIRNFSKDRMMMFTFPSAEVNTSVATLLSMQNLYRLINGAVSIIRSAFAGKSINT